MTAFALGLVIGSTLGAFTTALFAVGAIKREQVETERLRKRFGEALKESRRFEAALNGTLHGEN